MADEILQVSREGESDGIHAQADLFPAWERRLLPN